MTYIPIARGFVYLVALMDWYSRRVLTWRISNSMTADYCVEALEEPIARYCVRCAGNLQHQPGLAIRRVELHHDARSTQDPHQHGRTRGAWRDNLFVERLWGSVKYEEVYLHAYDSVAAAKAGIDQYFTLCNSQRPHTALDRGTPDTVYLDCQPLAAAA